MQKLAQKTANQLAVQGIISQKDTAVYCYGLEALYSSLLELLTILFLSFFDRRDLRYYFGTRSLINK